MNTPLLEVRGITRTFPGVTALSKVDFDVLPGEVHALVGENGAGKSTLLSIINGLLPPDSGEIKLEGKAVTLNGPAEAIAHRLAMVHQELVLCPNLSVAENIFLGREKVATGGSGRLRDLKAKARELLDEIKVDLDPATPVGELSLNEQQIVEICRALSSRPKVLVFDEPTASLDDNQVAHLLEIIGKLREAGLGVVYVSHRLNEIFAISDRITVLRDGQTIGTVPTAEIDERGLVSMMVGRDYDPAVSSYTPRDPGAVALELDRLGREGNYQDISLQVRKGEIVGLAGLLGCHREAVVRSIFGALPPDRGTIKINGGQVSLNSPRSAIAQGISFMPADRKEEGLVLGMSVEDNLTLTVLDRIRRFGLIKSRTRKTLADGLIRKLSTKVSTPKQPVKNLSGGNQQKVVIGKWMARQGQIIIAEDPTRGVDIGAKAEIWAALQELAKAGCAIILITTELEEMMGASDRIIVMNRGRISGEFERHEFDAETIAHRFVN